MKLKLGHLAPFFFFKRIIIHELGSPSTVASSLGLADLCTPCGRRLKTWGKSRALLKHKHGMAMLELHRNQNRLLSVRAFIFYPLLARFPWSF